LNVKERDRDAFESYKENVSEIKTRLKDKAQRDKDLSMKNYNAILDSKDEQFSDKKSQMSKTQQSYWGKTAVDPVSFEL
jgi:hypothetical protein